MLINGKKMNKSDVCFLGEISISPKIIKNALSTMNPYLSSHFSNFVKAPLSTKYMFYVDTRTF